MPSIDIARQQDLDDHNVQHESGGSDEISVEGLSGVLSEPQPVQTHDNTAHTENFVLESTVASADGVASLDSSGEIPSAQIPALALTSVTTVDQSSGRTTVTDVQEGDVVIEQETDGSGNVTANDSYIFTGGDPSTDSSWAQLESDQASVTTVNGEVGDVTLGPSDVGSLPSGDYNPVTDVEGELTNYTNISALDSQVNTNASEIGTNASDISNNSSSISTNSADISTNSDNISVNQGNISSNDTDISNLQSNKLDASAYSPVTDVDGEVDAAATTVAGLDDQVSTNISDISSVTTDYQNHDHSGADGEQTSLSPSAVNAGSVTASNRLDVPTVASRSELGIENGIFFIEDEDQLTFQFTDSLL